ncbi:hypothetical protein ABZX75_31480 [Streptomyces sp. NPDC003038]|uniref:hypothetical protein n=1 Tax=unclassified Streptomyces TaxID=2593676 RepID=UPI0033A869A9
MTRDDLCEMLAEQTPACGPAREALLSGGAFDVWEGLVRATNASIPTGSDAGSRRSAGR